MTGEMDVFKAGKIAVNKIAEYLNNGVTFNQETTLCGKSIINNIRKAKKLGYLIEMYYVGLDSADIAKDRVKQRVERGGHGINEKDIEKRYEETFVNLNLILNEIDLAVFYDNTYQFRRFAIVKKGKIVRLSSRVPKWFEKVDI